MSDLTDVSLTFWLCQAEEKLTFDKLWPLSFCLLPQQPILEGTPATTSLSSHIYSPIPYMLHLGRIDIVQLSYGYSER